IGTLPFKDTYDTRASVDLKWSKLDSLLMDKVVAASANGATEIEITDKDIKDFPENSIAGMPHSFAALCSLYADSNEDLDNGKFSVRLSSFGGSSAGSMLGRFCHLDDGLRNNVRQLLADEQTSNPNAVYAEVVHLPQGRIGNVIARPVLREYEIPFLTSPGVDEEFQINIDDLWVFVAYGRIVIWSKRLKKEVIPRLSSAHNFSSHALSVYHFLCSLQSQHYRFCGFGWSGAFGRLDYLPRVRLGHLICAPQLWRFSSDLWLAFKKVDAADFATKMAAFRQKYKLPQWILYSVGDNNLQVNLTNPVAVQTFLNELKKDQTITVEEVLSESFKLAAQTKGQPVEHEILLPMVCHHDKSAGSVKSVKPPFDFYQNAAATRQHIPGGEWLMLKIYTGNTTCDHLLRDKIAPLIKETVAQTPIKSWFFMRFGDPDWHIRLRLNAAPEVLYGTLMPKLNALLQPLYQQGLVNKVEVTTYQQELERYGGEHCMGLSEKMFQHDSGACLSLLQLLEEQPADVRWQATLLGCDYLAKDFGLNTEARHQLFKSQRDNFASEFNETSVLRKEMGKKYRLHETHLQQILLTEEQAQSTEEQTELWQAIHQVFARRSSATTDVIASIRELEEARKLCINVEMLIRSYLHMFMNRMFVSNARQQELLVYEFLNRVYDFAKFRR
ncbi:MAG: lantibiotic dehydratase, partial [Psychrosphaera sp.]|nr:lantibiotic dehydratase [Psychrosphaera sp.]